MIPSRLISSCVDMNAAGGSLLGLLAMVTITACSLGPARSVEPAAASLPRPAYAGDGARRLSDRGDEPTVDEAAPTASDAETSVEVEGEKTDEDEVFLKLDEIDVREVRPWTLRLRADATFAFFESENNVEGFEEEQVISWNPAVYSEWRFTDALALALEVDYDGIIEQLGSDQAHVRFEALKDLLTLKVGRNYFPFGLEKSYYSPLRNNLIQRPAAFRVIYPGTYADNGIHLLGKYTHSSGRVLGYEAAVVQGLRGFRREDLPGPLDLRDNDLWPWRM